MFTLLTIFITAITTWSIMAMVPVVKQKWNAFKNAKKRKALADNLQTHNTDILVERINELEKQIDNVAKKVATRDRDRRSNLRRDVRDYLKELQK